MADAEDLGRGRWERAREWLLIEGHREVIAVGVLVGLYVLLVAWPTPLPDPETAEPSVTRLFASLVGGNLTLITVVIAINQLVLSRELRTPRALTEEIDASIRFRDEVAVGSDPRAMAESPSPFLDNVLGRLADAIEGLGSTVGDVNDPALEREVSTVTARLQGKVGDMRPLLRERDVDLFTALSTILRRNLAPEYNRCRWLEHVHGSTLGADCVVALAVVQRRIVHLEIARHYVKTIYVQVELAQLSRRLLYVGLLALVTSVLAIVTVSSVVAAPAALFWLAVTVSFAPFAYLLASILRVATVAQRTAAFVPFGGTE